jgi:hypothetical protein
MAITKEKSIDQITVSEDGIVMVREVTRIVEDGTELSRSYHRSSFTPGQDVSDQPDKVKNICLATWTPEVIEAFNLTKE